MWAARSRAIRAIPRCYYDEASLSTWASVPMPAELPDVIAALESVAAICDGQIVGWGLLDRAAWRLEAMFVDPDYQRRGIAREMYGSLEATLKHGGHGLLSVSSTLNAAPFYQRMGFVERERSKYHHPSGFVLDCIHMDKQIV